MTSSVSRGDPPHPPESYSKFLFFYSRVLPVLLGLVGVLSLTRAGFLKADWIGWTVLGLGCFVLMALISYFVFE